MNIPDQIPILTLDTSLATEHVVQQVIAKLTESVEQHRVYIDQQCMNACELEIDKGLGEIASDALSSIVKDTICSIVRQKPSVPVLDESPSDTVVEHIRYTTPAGTDTFVMEHGYIRRPREHHTWSYHISIEGLIKQVKLWCTDFDIAKERAHKVDPILHQCTIQTFDALQQEWTGRFRFEEIERMLSDSKPVPGGENVEEVIPTFTGNLIRKAKNMSWSYQIQKRKRIYAVCLHTFDANIAKARTLRVAQRVLLQSDDDLLTDLDRLREEFRCARYFDLLQRIRAGESVETPTDTSVRYGIPLPRSGNMYRARNNKAFACTFIIGRKRWTFALRTQKLDSAVLRTADLLDSVPTMSGIKLQQRLVKLPRIRHGHRKRYHRRPIGELYTTKTGCQVIPLTHGTLRKRTQATTWLLNYGRPNGTLAITLWTHDPQIAIERGTRSEPACLAATKASVRSIQVEESARWRFAELCRIVETNPDIRVTKTNRQWVHLPLGRMEQQPDATSFVFVFGYNKKVWRISLHTDNKKEGLVLVLKLAERVLLTDDWTKEDLDRIVATGQSPQEKPSSSKCNRASTAVGPTKFKYHDGWLRLTTHVGGWRYQARSGSTCIDEHLWTHDVEVAKDRALQLSACAETANTDDALTCTTLVNAFRFEEVKRRISQIKIVQPSEKGHISIPLGWGNVYNKKTSRTYGLFFRLGNTDRCRSLRTADQQEALQRACNIAEVALLTSNPTMKDVDKVLNQWPRLKGRSD